MPNLCGTRLEESGGKMSKEEQMALLWAASNSMDGGLDTVSYLQSSSSIHKETNDLNKKHIFTHVILDGNDLEFKNSDKGTTELDAVVKDSPLCLSYLLSKCIYYTKPSSTKASLTLFKTTFMRGTIFQKEQLSFSMSSASFS